MRKIVAALLLAALALALPIQAAATQEQAYFTVCDASGRVLFRMAGELFIDDEYISAENQLYRIDGVDESQWLATAVHVGEEPSVSRAAYAGTDQTLAEVSAAGSKKLICLYCTHSGESFEPTDGQSSTKGRGSILDVAQAFASELNDRGIETIVDETLHHPHDSGAYRRSQSTAAKLAKKMPAALIDIHRDGIPAEEYATEIEGEYASKVRLLVGRSNANSAANREFAKQLKASADELYPGLIKDIFIGKGNYNQELMPRAILLEFGTHELEKETVLRSTGYMADVIQAAVFGEAPGSTQTPQTPQTTPKAKGGAAAPGTTPRATQGATAEQQGAETPAIQSNKGSSGILWVIGIFVVGLIVVGLIAGGKGGLGGRLKRTMSEMTGGATGRKPKDDDRLS